MTELTISEQQDDRPRRAGEAEVVRAGVRRYLRGEAIDMSELAAELGVGRATLYRRIGNRDRLLGMVLADRTEHSFRAAERRVRGLTGTRRILVLMHEFMAEVLQAEPLKVFVQREPLLFIRLATSMGPIETRAAALMGEVMAEEAAAGHFVPGLPIPMLAEATVRLCDAYMYADLLGGPPRDIRTAIDVAALLLEQNGQRTPQLDGAPQRSAI